MADGSPGKLSASETTGRLVVYGAPSPVVRGSSAAGGSGAGSRVRGRFEITADTLWWAQRAQRSGRHLHRLAFDEVVGFQLVKEGTVVLILEPVSKDKEKSK